MKNVLKLLAGTAAIATAVWGILWVVMNFVSRDQLYDTYNKYFKL